MINPNFVNYYIIFSFINRFRKFWSKGFVSFWSKGFVSFWPNLFSKGFVSFGQTFSQKVYMNRVDQLKAVQQNALELFTKKNIDYGDAFAKYGIIGVLMRIEDKIQRSLSITKNGVNLVNDEGIRDTLLDLHNYAAMALMLLDEK